eukprot:TRINITY_DN11463_c0_g1_i1.p1 TRINITY_DN11463_c0_g1~~TRINITY_DN11463_c0_g1_i1.p1  ORF type:complete len:411 (-),score=101.18 TRINITY_DN11463_c0_g1_i1:284-1516(-)
MDDSEDAARAAIAAAEGSLPAAIAELKAAIQQVPSAEDFHFFNNFPSFQSHAAALQQQSTDLLCQLSPARWPEDPDDAYDWLVSSLDDLLEQVDTALDETKARKKQRTTPGGTSDVSPPPDPVFGNRRKFGIAAGTEGKAYSKAGGKGKQDKVPFHVPSIPRPQDSFNKAIDNSSVPFEHPAILPWWTSTLPNAQSESMGRRQQAVDEPSKPIASGISNQARAGGVGEGRVETETLEVGGVENVRKEEKGADLPTQEQQQQQQQQAQSCEEPPRGLAAHVQRMGLRGSASASARQHPLGSLLRGSSYYQAWQLEANAEGPRQPPAMGLTPFHFVDSVEALEAMAVKLRVAKEIAVDLEHNSYRSFQGLVCLMQVSTREEDFLVDPLGFLHDKIGPMLGEVFANPAIVKVR